MSIFIDLTGKRFGRWVVLNRGGVNKHGRILWKCRCDCGSEREVSSGNLLRHLTKSCGCQRRETAARQALHHLTRTPEWNTWVGIRNRCSNRKEPAYKYYGARGISVCDRWQESFTNFLADMGPKPGPKFSIDRVDNDGNYEPGNCRWATQLEQVNNTRHNTHLTFQSRTQNISQWAKELGFPSDNVIVGRIGKLKWTIKKALTTPLNKNISKARKISWMKRKQHAKT